MVNTFYFLLSLYHCKAFLVLNCFSLLFSLVVGDDSDWGKGGMGVMMVVVVVVMVVVVVVVIIIGCGRLGDGNGGESNDLGTGRGGERRQE